MIGTIYINGIIQDALLLDVIKQVKAQKNATEFLVKIDSVGGYVAAGYSIYDYLKNLNCPITTYTTKAFSIASVIFMAGEKRIIPEGTPNALMIHLPWATVQGTSNTLAVYAANLKEAENKLITFYSERLQIDENSIQSLLNKETYLDSNQALEMGMATEIQPVMKAVAMINNIKQEENLMDKVLKKANQILNKLNGVKAELVLQDATGVELVFPDLEPTDVATADEKVTIDGKPADGKHLMPDGSTLMLANGVLTEIVPAEAPVEEDAPLDATETDAPIEDAPSEEEQADDKDAKISELEAEIADLKAKLSELEGAKAEEVEITESRMLEVVALAAEKVTDLEAKYQALAKQVGSDFQPEIKKENTPTVKASAEQKSRAWQILNS